MKFKFHIFSLLLIILFTILSYSNIFANQFVIDDTAFLIKWPQIEDADHIDELIVGNLPLGQEGVYRPVRSIIYLLSYPVNKQIPFNYHVEALLVYLLIIITVYLLFLKIIKNNYATFLGTLIFALHPLHTEAITYITASFDAFAALFYLLSFYFYINKSKRCHYLISVLFAFLAIFTNELAITLPMVILIYAVIVKKTDLKKEYINFIPYFSIAFIYLFIRFFLLHTIGRGEYLDNNFLLTQLTMAKVFVKYFQLMLIPYPLSINPQIDQGIASWISYLNDINQVRNQTILDLKFLIAILLLSIGFIFSWLTYSKYPLVGFSWLWFLIALFPVMYILPQGNLMSERFGFISSIGFTLLLSVLIKITLEKIPKIKYLLVVVILIYALFLGYLTYLRNFDWKDNKSLWISLIRQEEGTILGYFNLGYINTEEKDYDNAIYHYKKALEIKPDFAQARYYLSKVYEKIGKNDLAVKEQEQVLKDDPTYIDLWKEYSFEKLSFKYHPRWVIEKQDTLILKAIDFKAAFYFYSLKHELTEEELMSEPSLLKGQILSAQKYTIQDSQDMYLREIKTEDKSNFIQIIIKKNENILEVNITPVTAISKPEVQLFIQSILLK